MNGRPVDDPNVRIARLTQARKLFKRADTCNMEALGLAAGVTANRIAQEVKADSKFPIMKRGYMGVEWVFNAHKAIDYMLAQAKARVTERENRADLLSRLSGITVDPKLLPQHMSIAELKEIDRLQTQAQRRKIEQGQYVPREDHEGVVSTIFEQVQEVFISVATEADASGLWPADVSDSVSEYFRNSAAQFQSRVIAELEKRGISSEGTRRASR